MRWSVIGTLIFGVCVAHAQKLAPSSEEGWTPPVYRAVTPPATRAEYFVKTDGNDSNNGLSWETAWKTIKHAVQTAPDGSTITVAPGTYVEDNQLVINRRLEIRGWGLTPAATIIKPANNTTLSGDGRGFFLVTAPVAADPATDYGLDLWNVTLDGEGKNVAIAILSTTSRINIHDCIIKNIGWQGGGPPNYYGRGICAYAYQYNWVARCTFENIGRIGVFTFGTGVHTQVTECSYTGKGDGDWLDYAFEGGGGAELDVYWSTVSNCTGVASSDGSTSAGILATTYFDLGTSLAAEWNFVNNNTHGIAVGYNQADSTLAAAVRYNHLADNEWPISNSNSNNLVNGYCNWFGSHEPATVAALAGTGVDYSPWLHSGTDMNTDPDDPESVGFQPDLSVLWVDDDSPNYWPDLGVIEQGIDEVSGSTVYLAPGLYEEQVEINVNNLELIGSGSGSDPNVDAIIRSPVGPLTYKFQTGSLWNYPIIGVHDCTGVSIENLRVDGYGRGNNNYRFIGIAFWNAGGSVEDCVVTGVRNTPLSGAQHGVGIYAYNNTGGPYTVNVTDTYIDDYQKNGMALSGNGLTANVSGCTVVGSGPLGLGLPAQNGIQISSGAGGTVDRCTISDNMYTGGSWAATGLLLWGATSVQVTNTTLTDNTPGVYCQDTASATFDGIDVSNQHANSGDGFYAYNSTSTLRDDGPAPRLAVAPLAEEADRGMAERGPMAIVIRNSTFTGHDATDSWGIGAYASGTKPVTVTLAGSTIRDWDYGIVAYYDDDYTGPVNIVANYNQILSNATNGFQNLFPSAVMNAEYNWWGDADGPADATGASEVSLEDCGSYTVDQMKNAEPGGSLGDAVSENVDYCPWLTQVPQLTLEPDDGCYEAGDTVTVQIWMRDVEQTIVGGQFFLEYDTNYLQLADLGDAAIQPSTDFYMQVYECSVEYQSVPPGGQWPQCVPTEGQIGYAVGRLPPGQNGDAHMATLTFRALTEICNVQDLITWRPSNPPTRLSDPQGQPVYPVTINMDVVDNEPPVITCPSDVTRECDELTDPRAWSVQYLIDNSQTVLGVNQIDRPRDNRGLAMSPDGRYLYAGYNNPSGGFEVRKIDLTQADYTDATVAHLVNVSRGKAIAVDDVGRVYLGDATDVKIYDPNVQTNQYTITVTGGALEGVATTRVGGQLVLYVSNRNDGKLRRYLLTESGGAITGAALDTTWGSNGTIYLAPNIRGVEVAPNGSIWVAGHQTNAVYIVAPDGSSYTQISGVTKAMDIGFSDAYAYVTQYTQRVISVYDPNSLSLVTTLTAPWAELRLDPDGQSGNGAFSGIVVLPNGDFYVANEAGQTADEKSTYGRADSHSGYDPNTGLYYTDLCHDDNDPILRLVGTGIPSVVDNCDPNPEIAYEDEITDGPCPDRYTITRTWTATDHCGNSSQCVQTITVQDTTPPTISCPEDVTVECDESTDPDDTGWATATDNCDPNPQITYTDQITAGSCPDSYTITRTWKAKDACNNESTCVQTITVQDTTAPVIACPENTTIECDEMPLGWARGGVLVMYNNYGPENPNNQAWFRAQYSQTNTDGAIFNFEPGPWGYGPSHPFQVIPDQFGLDFTLPAPTRDPNLNNPPLVWFTAVDNVNGTCAGANLVGQVSWAISGYTPPIPDPAACPVNSLLRSATPPAAGQVVVTQWNLTQAGNVWTLAVEGYLVSDGYIHWYTPSFPDTPMSNFGWNGQFHFRGVLKYNSQGDPGNDGDFYNGALVLYANSLPPSTGWATATDNCDPGPIITFTDTYTPGACGYTGTIYRVWKATDRCGNYSTCTQVITVVDTTAPTFTYVPANRTVNADAGQCTAVLDPPLGMATATDNCDPNVTVTYVRSDDPNKALTDPYPAGTTTITWTARDCSNNTTTAYTTVTVNAVNDLQVTVDLAGTVAAGPFTRCIRFELWDCNAPTPTPTIVDSVLTFTNGSASATIQVPCGVYNCITARDRLHTLRRTAAIVDAGAYYTASFTGEDALIGGNLNDDRWIDILDFGVFSWQWSTNYGTGSTTCTTPYPHADISGDGVVDTADFTFIQTYFLLGHEANCCGAPGFRGEDEAGPLTRIAVADLARYGLEHLAVADLNGDGWIDEYDVAAFASGVVPQPQTKPQVQIDELLLSPVPVEAEEK